MNGDRLHGRRLLTGLTSMAYTATLLTELIGLSWTLTLGLTNLSWGIKKIKQSWVGRGQGVGSGKRLRMLSKRVVENTERSSA